MTTNILDKYDIINKNYTKGIKVNQCTFSGTNHFSIWEYSGYEPYKIIYDHFIGDQNCIHVIVYDLSKSKIECFRQCIYWLEFLKSRLTKKASKIFNNDLNAKTTSRTTLSNQDETFIPTNNNNDGNSSRVKILFVATHADMEKSCFKGEDGIYVSDKSNHIKKMLENYFLNDELFDLSLNHFVLDSRAAWVADIKSLINYLCNLKNDICKNLPRSTMFLNRTLYYLQLWRKNTSVSINSVTNQDSLSRNGSINASTTSSFISFNNSNTDNSNATQRNLSLSTLNLNSVNNILPLMSWKNFKEKVRELINPLASDEHLMELLLQLQLMGEVILIENNYDEDLLCYNPEWLCQTILGRLFSHERFFNVKPTCLNGIYTKSDIKEIYSDLMNNQDNFDLIKDIFISFDLCTELEDSVTTSKDLVYEFNALNFLSEPVPVAFQTLKLMHNSNKPLTFVFNGFRLKCSSFHIDKNFDFVSNLINNNQSLMNGSMTSMTSSFVHFNPPPILLNLNLNNSSQLAYLFFRIQTHLRLLTTNFYNNLELEDLINNNNSSDLNNYYSNKYNSLKNSKQNSFDNYNKSDSNQNNYLQPQDMNYFTNKVSKSLTSLASSSANHNHNNRLANHSSHHFNNTKMTTSIISDIELQQTRYCSRIMRKNLNMECLIILDHLNGEYIELKACSIDLYRDELFYFVEDIFSLIKQVINDSCPGINLEKHYLSFKQIQLPPAPATQTNSSINLGIVTHDCIFTPKDIITKQLTNNSQILKCPKTGHQAKLIDLICCGSERIEKSLIFGIDMPITQMNDYTRRMLCVYLDKVDPMGRDWSILAFLLGLQDILPVLDETINTSSTISISKCDYVLNEWSRLKPEQATIRNLISKINDLDRKDVNEIIFNTNYLYYVNNLTSSNLNATTATTTGSNSNNNSILNSSQMLNSLK